jgi:hypothetical protein
VSRSSPRPLAVERPRQVWAYDFIFDGCANGQKLKMLTVVDEWTRECLAIEVGAPIHSGKVLEVLGKLMSVHGQPEYLRSDNVLTQKSSTFFQPDSSLQLQSEALAFAAIEVKNLRPLARRALRVLDFCLASADRTLQGS